MKNLFFIFFALLVINGFSQGGVIAHIDHEKELIQKTETGCKSEFTLFADKEQMAAAHSEASKYIAYMKFTSTDVSEAVENAVKNQHWCTLEFTHVVPVEYIHKMMLTFGVEKFEYNGKIYPLNELVNVIKK